MKKILLLVCLAFACQVVLAQDDDDEKKKKIDDMFGVSFGPGYSNIVGKDENNDPLWGFQGGLYVGLVHAKNYRLNTHLLFSRQGAKFSNDSKYVLDYLELPIMFDYMVAPNLYLGAGIQPGLLLSAKYKYGDQSMDIKDNLKSVDFGIPLHVGYDFTKTFGIGFYYVPGIADIADNNNGSSIHNSLETLRLTYRF